MILWIEEILIVARVPARKRQRQAHEFCLWTYLMNAFHNRVVALGVILRCGVMLGLYLIEHFPKRKRVMVARLMSLSVLVRESAIGVPTHQPAEVVA